MNHNVLMSSSSKDRERSRYRLLGIHHYISYEIEICICRTISSDHTIRIKSGWKTWPDLSDNCCQIEVASGKFGSNNEPFPNGYRIFGPQIIRRPKSANVKSGVKAQKLGASHKICPTSNSPFIMPPGLAPNNQKTIYFEALKNTMKQ